MQVLEDTVESNEWEEVTELNSLESSCEYMISDDWKKRLIAEYAQLVYRINRVLDLIWEPEEHQDGSNCPVGLLDLQAAKMTEYQQILEIRAEIYGINLHDEIEKLNKIT